MAHLLHSQSDTKARAGLPPDLVLGRSRPTHTLVIGAGHSFLQNELLQVCLRQWVSIRGDLLPSGHVAFLGTFLIVTTFGRDVGYHHTIIQGHPTTRKDSPPSPRKERRCHWAKAGNPGPLGGVFESVQSLRQLTP